MLSRTLACIADVIASKAAGRGGLRSGPAANVDWQHGITLLKVSLILLFSISIAIGSLMWFSYRMMCQKHMIFNGQYPTLYQVDYKDSSSFKGEIRILRQDIILGS